MLLDGRTRYRGCSIQAYGLLTVHEIKTYVMCKHCSVNRGLRTKCMIELLNNGDVKVGKGNSSHTKLFKLIPVI